MAQGGGIPTGSNVSQVLYDDGSPLVHPSVLKDKRLLLVNHLDVETVLTGLKPYLKNEFFIVNAINAEPDCGKKRGKLLDFLQRYSVKVYGKFNAFLRIIAGTQPDLFHALVGRVPSEKEADFCILNLSDRLKGVIQDHGHSIDSPLDEKIDFDSHHVELAIVRDKPDVETSADMLHRYQSHLSKVEGREDNVPAVELLTVAADKEKPKRVSLHGRAGTGKTTTFQWLAREWSFNRWGSQFTVLFLLQLRMLSVCDRHMTAVELLTMAGLYQVTEAGLVMPLASWLKNSGRKALLFIDGLDEVTRFAERLRNCLIISDLNQKAHPIDLCLNILRGNLLTGVTVISASRPFTGLDALPFDTKFEVLGLTESRVKEFVKRKRPSKAADIISVLTTSPLLMSVCSITFYCALISRLLADGVVFQNEELQTYTRLMAFLIVQCVERKLSDWSFTIHVGPYFRRLAHMSFMGTFERELKGEMSKLVFNDRDLSQAGLAPYDLQSIQKAGLLHFQKSKVGMRSSVTAEFLHFSVQEILASAYLLSQSPLSDNIFSKLFSGGQFSTSLLHIFGVQCDTASDWIKDIRDSVFPPGQELKYSMEKEMDAFIQDLYKQSSENDHFSPRLQICQLLHEGQMEERAKSVVEHIVRNGTLAIKNVQMTLIDLMAIWFVVKYADTITEITLENCGLTDTLLGFITSTFLRENTEKLQVLNLKENKISFGVTNIFTKWLMENHSLHTLCIWENDFNETGAKAIAGALQKNKTLCTLNVGISNIGDVGVKAFSAALQENNTLQSLFLCSTGIGPNGASALATILQNTSIEDLDVSNNNISDTGVLVLATALQKNKKLLSLSLYGNKIGVDGTISLATSLQNSSLQSLNMGHNQIGANGAKVIARALKVNNTLQTLNLWGNNIHEDGAVALAKALQNNRVLRKLNLGGNDIGDEGTKAITTELLGKSPLEALSLWGNNITTNGLIPMAIALQGDNTLRTLTLSGNKIDEAGAAALAAVLQTNRTLRYLDVAENQIGHAALAALQGMKHQELTLITDRSH